MILRIKLDKPNKLYIFINRNTKKKRIKIGIKHP